MLRSCFSFQQDIYPAAKAVGSCSLVPQHMTIQKDRGRARYAQRCAPLRICTNPLVNHIAVHVGGELIQLKVKLPCIRKEDWPRIVQLGPLFLIAIEPIVHLPKLVLIVRRLSRVRRGQSVLVNPGQRKMMKDDLHLVAVFFFDLL